MPVRLPLFVTPAHECGYLTDRSARSAFVDPSAPKNPELLSILSRHGFRRSGSYIYRPACPECRACVALRIPVREFRPTDAASGEHGGTIGISGW